MADLIGHPVDTRDAPIRSGMTKVKPGMTGIKKVPTGRAGT